MPTAEVTSDGAARGLAAPIAAQAAPNQRQNARGRPNTIEFLLRQSSHLTE
jgi:hypothetical protein